VLVPRPSKDLGWQTLEYILPSLGLMLAVVEALQTMARFGVGKRNNSQVRSEAVEYRLTRRLLRKIGRKGGQLSRSKMTRRRATQIARHASAVR
jgi:hypothetical protein